MDSARPGRPAKAVLGISPKRLQEVIGKARMCGESSCRLTTVAASLPHDGRIDVARPRGEAAPELLACIRGLTPGELAAIVALAWIGRGTYEPCEWEEALAEAAAAQGERLFEYAACLPMLGDTLDEGLAALAQERGFAGNVSAQ
jgi:hypothetical protein